jgi:hypothetical protein
MRLDKHVTSTPCLNTGSHEWGQNKQLNARGKSAERKIFHTRLKSEILRNYRCEEEERIIMAILLQGLYQQQITIIANKIRNTKKKYLKNICIPN